MGSLSRDRPARQKVNVGPCMRASYVIFPMRSRLSKVLPEVSRYGYSAGEARGGHAASRCGRSPCT